jgi:transcriptional regulator with XRE-family HTH domain
MDVAGIDAHWFRRKTSRVPKLSHQERTRLGQLLRELREAPTPIIKQADIAQKIDCAIGTVQAIEHNKHDVNPDTIEQYAEVFGTTIHQLLHPASPTIAPSDSRYADFNHEHLEIARGYMRGTKAVRTAVEVLVTAEPYAEELAALMVALQRALEHSRDTQIAYWMTTLLDQGDLVKDLARRLEDDPAFKDTLAALLEDAPQKDQK